MRIYKLPHLEHEATFMSRVCANVEIENITFLSLILSEGSIGSTIYEDNSIPSILEQPTLSLSHKIWDHESIL